MASKFDGLLDDLKPLPVEDQSYQDKVNKAKEQFTDRAPMSLAFSYARWRGEVENIKAQLYQANMHLEAVCQLIEDSRERGEEGWGAYGVADNALRLPTGETVYVRKEPYGVVKDKDAFRRWCLANGYADELMLWPTKMNAIVKERLMAGEPFPDGTDAFAKTKVVFEKARVK